MPRPRKADVHAHLLPRELPDFKSRFGYGGFIRLVHRGKGEALMVRDDGRVFRRVGPALWDVETRLADMERAGVDVQVLSTVPVMFSYWTKPRDGLAVARFLNDHLASFVSGRSNRFVGLATLPMQEPTLAARELERAVRELGLAGAQLGTNVGGLNLDEARFGPVFAAAQDLGAALFIHPWDMMGSAQMQKYWLPWLVGMPAELSRAICSMIFGGVFERFPRLRVVFAHGGGSFGSTLGRIRHGFKARPDLCAVDNPHDPSRYLGRFWVDSLVHDGAVLRLLLELFGPERVALGTDYPFPLGEEKPGALIESLRLPGAVLARLLFDNAMAWLGRSRAVR